MVPEAQNTLGYGPTSFHTEHSLVPDCSRILTLAAGIPQGTCPLIPRQEIFVQMSLDWLHMTCRKLFYQNQPTFFMNFAQNWKKKRLLLKSLSSTLHTFYWNFTKMSGDFKVWRMKFELRSVISHTLINDSICNSFHNFKINWQSSLYI